MIDLFLITEDITDFHIRNLLANPHHYCPAARILGHKYVCAVQNRGNKVYYNPYIQIQDEVILSTIYLYRCSNMELSKKMTC